MPKLTALKIKSLPDGRYSDGGGLYLRKRGSGLRWIFRYQQAGRVRDVVLGGPEMTLLQARESAVEARQRVRAGVAVVSPSKPSAVTLGEAVDEWIGYASGGWRSKTERGHTERQLKFYFGKWYNRPLTSITKSEIVEVLKPIWLQPMVADKLLSRVSRVFQRAQALDLITVNPCDPAVIRMLMPRVRHTKSHHPAVPVTDAPAVWKALSARQTMGANALKLIVLSACRSNEARSASWTEFDLEAGVWSIPGSRTKTGKPLRVPLTALTLEVLRGLPRVVGSDLLFPSRVGNPLSDVAVGKEQRKLHDEAHVHGWRSTFRDFGAGRRFDRDALEISLGHAVAGEVERAYFRDDLLDERRKIMEAWHDYLCGKLA